ncbi:hypothetical protein, partial [Wolbachia endosymbiont of Pentidionis agamae]|uniref:hypothetical protein n=1 Tax=Wolbachia endosymbiont of Pentidionis agamae TaxID=3110435 RepID=UPI002FCF3885
KNKYGKTPFQLIPDDNEKFVNAKTMLSVYLNRRSKNRNSNSVLMYETNSLKKLLEEVNNALVTNALNTSPFASRIASIVNELRETEALFKREVSRLKGSNASLELCLKLKNDDINSLQSRVIEKEKEIKKMENHINRTKALNRRKLLAKSREKSGLEKEIKRIKDANAGSKRKVYKDGDYYCQI